MLVRFYEKCPTGLSRECALLQAWCGPMNGKTPKPGSRVWVIGDKRLEAFASAVWYHGNIWLRNCVVAEDSRGRGHQKTLIEARIKWARSAGADKIYTHTDSGNWHSARNLIASGFQVSSLVDEWVYWRLDA